MLLHNNCIDEKAIAEAADVRAIPKLSPDEEKKMGETGKKSNRPTTAMKAQFSDVVTMWATIVDYESYVYPNTGSSFIQSLSYHLVNSQGGTRMTGGDRIRDLHDAHLAITQEVSSQPIFANVKIENKKSGEWEYKCLSVNQTPLYQSTACGKKVGFQIVAEEERCNRIDYYYAKEILEGSSNGGIDWSDSHTPTARAQLDKTTTLNVTWSKIDPSTEPMETN